MAGTFKKCVSKCVSAAFFILFCTILAVLLVNTAGRVHVSYDAFDFTLGARLSLSRDDMGVTRLMAPPVGSAYSRTHRGPLLLWASLEEVDASRASELLAGAENASDAIARIRSAAVAAAPRLALAVIALGIIGSMTGCLILGRRNARSLAMAALLGLIPPVFGLATAAATYDAGAFAEPSYTGIMGAAPWVVSAFDTSMGRISEVGRSLASLARDLNAATTAGRMAVASDAAAMGATGGGRGTVTIMHVSDIHNNAAVFNLVGRLARELKADAIIDTGDLTDFGTELESGMAGRVRALGIPYFFVPGNHDSPAVVERLSEEPNVFVLGSAPVEFKGLRIMGVHDPAAGDSGQIVPSRAQLAAAAKEAESAIVELGRPVDILAVHNIAAAPGGDLPVRVILHGHDHTPSLSWRGDTVVVDAGTTGAAGFRGYASGTARQYSLSLLRFVDRADAGKRLAYVDSVEVFEDTGEFSVVRKMISHPD